MAFQNITVKQPNPTIQTVTKPNETVATAPVIRKIAPLTQYNPDTGVVETAESPWSQKEATQEETTEKTQESKTQTSQDKVKPKTDEKHSQWMADQKAKREAREEAKLAKQVKQQTLAKDFLMKGDAVGAAKALGLSPAEFAMYAQNAMLSIPTKQEEMTPEQKQKQEWEDYRKERAAFEQEQRQWRANKDYQDYTARNFDPILADKDKFEFCNRNGVEKMKQFAYEYMNKHYQETTVYDSSGKIIKQGEELNAADVFETIEADLERTFIKSLEGAKQINKLKKYFTPQEQREAQETEATEEQQTQKPMVQVSKFGKKFELEPTLANKKERPLDTRFPTKTQEEEPTEEQQEEELNPTTVKSVRPRITSKKSNTPFALLSHEERMELIKAGL